MMYLDLTEIDQVLSLSRLWSRKNGSPARFVRSDYFNYQQPAVQTSDLPELPADTTDKKVNAPIAEDVLDLDQSVRKAINHSLKFYPDGPIRLLTNLRYFGYCINPISCYYCFSGTEPDEGAEEQLQALLIEVTNTPWGEKTHYALDLRNHAFNDEIDFQKALHVSPFMEMDMNYQWRGKVPGALLQYSLTNITRDLPSDNTDNGKRIFDAGVKFRRTEITGQSLNRIIVRHPFMTMKVALGIYWQALRLTLKKVPFVPHPNVVIKVGKHDPK